MSAAPIPARDLRVFCEAGGCDGRALTPAPAAPALAGGTRMACSGCGAAYEVDADGEPALVLGRVAAAA